MVDRSNRGVTEKEPETREARAGETGTTRFGMAGSDEPATGKKKGDRRLWERESIGGDKKQRMKGESASRTGHKQNAGHGGHP